MLDFGSVDIRSWAHNLGDVISWVGNFVLSYLLLIYLPRKDAKRRSREDSERTTREQEFAQLKKEVRELLDWKHEQIGRADALREIRRREGP